MSNTTPPKSIVSRLPRTAFDLLAEESIRQCRPLPQIMIGAARAFASLPPEKREEFTVASDPLDDAARAGLGLKPAASVKPNRRKGGAQ